MNANITNIAHMKLSFHLKYALCKWKEHIENAICEKYIYVCIIISIITKVKRKRCHRYCTLHSPQTWRNKQTDRQIERKWKRVRERDRAAKWATATHKQKDSEILVKQYYIIDQSEDRY